MKLTHSLLFVAGVALCTAASAQVTRIDRTQFQPSAGTITFSEKSLGTSNPSYTPADYGGGATSPTVTFKGYFAGQSLGVVSPPCPTGAALTGCVLGNPTNPLSLAATSPNTFIASDGSNPTSPVLSGSPTFNGPIAVRFSTDLAAVGLEGGYFNAPASTAITAFRRDGTSLGRVTNNGTGIEFLGLKTASGNNEIAGLLFSLVGAEGYGFGIDNLQFGVYSTLITPVTPLPRPVVATPTIGATDNLVLVIHGWNSNSAAWPNQLVDAICAKLSISPSLPGITNTNSSGMDHQCQDAHWGVYAYNWAPDAATGLDPFTALANARDLGDQWAKVLWALAQHAGKSWKVVHLVGHSAGAGFVQEFAKTIKKLSNQNPSAPKIVATFLDAFCPDPDSCGYGMAPDAEPPAADLAEHYVDTRNVLPSWASHPLGDFNASTLGLTNIILPNALNFDITPLDNNGASNYGNLYPVDFHAFPYRYYLKTAGVTGETLDRFSAYTLDSLGFGAKWAPWAQSQTGDVWSATLANYAGFSKGDRCVTAQNLDLGLDSCNPSFTQRWFRWPANIASQSLQSAECLGALLNGTVSVGTCVLPVPSGAMRANAMAGALAASPDPGMALLRINLTRPANRIRFDYRFTQIGSGGGVQVFLQDDKMIFVTLQNTGDTSTHTTDWIDIPTLAAGDQNLRVVVKPMGGDNAGAEVSNLQFSYAGVDDFPTEASLPAGWVQPAGSNAPWTVASDAAYAGTRSLKSGVINHSQKSELSYSANFLAGNVSFARKVSSESCCDYLQFYVDGALQGAWSGELDWALVSFPLAAGPHTVLWRYLKDSSVSTGSDAAWIDSVLLPASNVTNYTVSIAKSGTGSGTVTSNPAGISCGATCSASYASGTTVTLTATAAIGNTFTSWSGGGCSGTGSCTVSMNQAQSVTATFTPASTGTLITRYRLYSDLTKEHLYTTDANEYSVLPVCCGWLAEGAIYKLFQGAGSFAGVDAVQYYRLYNPFSHQHHWTTDPNEYNVLGTMGWSKEGVDGYILPTAVTGSVPLYRLYLNAYGGLHLWTTDANEKNVLSTSQGWVDEGVAGYVVPLP